MKNGRLIGLLLCLTVYVTGWSQPAKEARRVIERYAEGGKVPVKVSVSLDSRDGCDVFETSVKNGKLYINASSGVAACRGFYEYVKSQGAGISSWSGNRLELPEKLADMEKRTVISPFKHHYYFNVVTFGYTMPYWDWERWEKEIDWMALHGIDMPLALVANEAISARVWKKLGLTDQEIADYFVGPAHFPWMRMGNISGIDGPLPLEWHEGQVELQHKILDRMKSLGMKPICPGFAGFLPKSMKRVFPDIELIETSWCGGAFHNWMLSPQNPLFTRIGQMFIEEWEKEFGKNDYYIVDSFNEMEIPFPPKGTEERYSLLADYGDRVYSSIKAGNPDAVWVMQGWMFGYQRHIWDYETLQSLVSKVPNEKMLLLDLAEDYNHLFWKNGANWEFYKGFYGKEWVYSVIPNMGGKSGLTGNLDFYANGRLKALHSANKGKLTEYGMAPEGIENNEVIYELISDGGWTADAIDVNKWLRNYSLCRYGSVSDKVTEFWDGMRKSVYGSFTDHPRYNWQFRPGSIRKGSINANDAFYQGIETLGNAIPDMKDSPLFAVDMIEMTAQYLGGKIEILVQAIDLAYQNGDMDKAATMETEFEALMLGADRLLCSHPTLRLENWLAYACNWGSTPELKNYYERNARRIVTVWGPPVDDYSARIWSGLLRDYYLPRWKQYFAAKRTGKASDIAAWELSWVEKERGLSEAKPYDDVLTGCAELIARAKSIDNSLLKTMNGEQLGSWSPADVGNDWKEVVWNMPVSKAALLEGIRFQHTRGTAGLEIEEVILEMDGVEVCKVTQYGSTGKENVNNTYMLNIPKDAIGNNSCRLRAKVKSNGQGESYGTVIMIMK